MAHCSSASQVGTDVSPIVMSDEERELLAVYHKAFNDDDVDYQLIKSIIDYIQAEYMVSNFIRTFAIVSFYINSTLKFMIFVFPD